MRRFIAGDPLRAVAALSVLTYHMAFGAAGLYAAGGDRATRFDDAYGPLGPLLANLDLGLYVFFVLSGYLLARPFLRAVVLGERLPALGGYVRNRALRIVPAYWFVLSVTMALHGPVGASPDQILAMYGFAQIYDPGPVTGLMVQAWTLDVEVAYYLALPAAVAALAWLMRGRGSPADRLWGVLGLLALVFAASLALRTASTDTDQYDRLLPCMIFAFVPGIALAALELWGRARGAEHAGPGWLQAGRRGPAVALGLLPGALALLVSYLATDPDALARRAGLAALGTGALVAAPLVLQWTRGRCWRGLDNPAMDWLGARSYSIYLVHFAIGVELVPVVRQLGSAWAAFLVLMALATPLSVLAAALVYRFVERPFLNWKRHRRPYRYVPQPEPPRCLPRPARRSRRARAQAVVLRRLLHGGQGQPDRHRPFRRRGGRTPDHLGRDPRPRALRPVLQPRRAGQRPHAGRPLHAPGPGSARAGAGRARRPADRDVRAAVEAEPESTATGASVSHRVPGAWARSPGFRRERNRAWPPPTRRSSRPNHCRRYAPPPLPSTTSSRWSARTTAVSRRLSGIRPSR